MELKLPPSTLKYAFLGKEESLPVIINSPLNTKEEEELLMENGEKKERDSGSLKRKKTESKRAHPGYQIVMFEPRSQRGPNVTHSSSHDQGSSSQGHV
ncbi:hypothetical protein PIB30_081947 [Stylosanthes scabra]|uniref:Uncharacterized protein n=1 Tax=Stylosanthes scabra TaxID=79078 RepID=A0ABU6TUP7_9FABA|nr:hypothetical protein [Stylosanthes scabra]